ncbi:hypothetical protein Ddc_15377 [Ditylenchus destructor]|nr:hypothetical protein Ddc_15377 [Ditylenchus destructor]
MIILSAEDWINVLKSLARSEVEKCQLVCRWIHLIVEQHSKILPYHYLDRCIVYGMLEKNYWKWTETELCADYTVSNPDEFYVIRCQKATHAQKKCIGFKATSETLESELRRNLRTTHARKFIFRRLTVTYNILYDLDSVFVDVMDCATFKTLIFDRCEIDEEIFEERTILDDYRFKVNGLFVLRQLARHMYFYVHFDDHAQLEKLLHKKAVQITDKIVVMDLEPVEVNRFVFGLGYRLRQRNPNFRQLTVYYSACDDATVGCYSGVLGFVLIALENDNLDVFPNDFPFSECILCVGVGDISESQVTSDAFDTLTLYSTIYDYDVPPTCSNSNSHIKDNWHHNFLPDVPKAMCVMEAYAYPDISTKFRALLHVWWLYVPEEDEYRFVKCEVILQNKNKDNYHSIFL